MNLKDKIEQANKAYRLGNSIISDKEYDELLEQYKKTISSEEFETFINSLNEGTIEYGEKIKHPYIMGSLSKLKYECPDEVIKFIDKYCHSLNVSAKIDGISCRLHYENGQLVSASTRGNGEEGTIITDKIRFVKFVPECLGTRKLAAKYKNIDIRGELVILKDDFAKMSGYANARNACAGIMNRKDFNRKDVAFVSFIAYTILGKEFAKEEQFALLKAWGFNTTWNETFRPYYFKDKKLDVVEELFKYVSQDFEYEVDGLVISSSDYINENTYRPEKQKAFKINQQVAITTVIDVAFDGPSKSGTHCPVAILEPIELGGVTVSRATLHNLDFIDEKGLKYGSKVKILRSGDVIPKIIEVVENRSSCANIVLPEICNCCGEKLIRDGVNLKCVNKNCKDQVIHRLTSFIKKLGVKSASDKTLEKLGILSFEDLIKFVPNKSYKTQVKLYDELKIKVFTRSKQDLLAAMHFKDISETLINKIVDFYGFDNIITRNYVGLPNGIGDITLQKFKDDILENLEYVNMFINDDRYSYTQNDLVASETKSDNKNGMSVCFTGKLNTMGRTEAEKKAIAAGFEIKAVNKKLTYLVTNDPDTNSGKGKKARELGIKIISENEFLKMISNQTLAQDVFEL